MVGQTITIERILHQGSYNGSPTLLFGIGLGKPAVSTSSKGVIEQILNAKLPMTVTVKTVPVGQFAKLVLE